MRRLLATSLIVMAASLAAAQSQYVGVGATVATDFSSGGIIPAPGFQYGTEVADDLEFRLQLDTLVLVSAAAADVVYSFDLDEEWRGYVGGGGDLLIFAFHGIAAIPGVHLVVGGEYRLNRQGLFLELQPSMAITTAGFVGPMGKVRSGINFYF